MNSGFEALQVAKSEFEAVMQSMTTEFGISITNVKNLSILQLVDYFMKDFLQRVCVLSRVTYDELLRYIVTRGMMSFYKKTASKVLSTSKSNEGDFNRHTMVQTLSSYQKSSPKSPHYTPMWSQILMEKTICVCLWYAWIGSLNHSKVLFLLLYFFVDIDLNFAYLDSVVSLLILVWQSTHLMMISGAMDQSNGCHLV